MIAISNGNPKSTITVKLHNITVRNRHIKVHNEADDITIKNGKLMQSNAEFTGKLLLMKKKTRGSELTEDALKYNKQLFTLILIQAPKINENCKSKRRC